MRARIDVSEIEAQTKIRAKYLRALENEEWGLLPGPTFVKSFLRTYAQALDLDSKALLEEYRLHHERPSEGTFEPIVSPSQRGRSRSAPSGPSRGYVFAVGAIVAVIIVLIVLLVSGGGSKKGNAPSTAASSGKHHTAKPKGTGTDTTKHATKVPLAALSLKATGDVYVCLLGDGGRKLIPGVELKTGESTSTYHAKRFQITLGNSSVEMFIDGTQRTVAESSQSIGYSITRAHGRRTLTSAQQPTCK
jgi:cytoskeleton protein RodZ